MKSIYRFLSSNMGIPLLFIVYILLFGSYFYGSSIDNAIAKTIGSFIGKLLPPMFFMLLLNLKYKWTERKQITNWLIFAYSYQLLFKIPGMETPLGVFSIFTIVVWFVAKIIRSISARNTKKGNEKSSPKTT